jgi:transposase-like protein
MLTLDEFIELREKLINNKIETDFVKKQLETFWQDLKEGKRSWYTKDWKKRKKKFIKEKCEICSSTEILTIQHKSHPKIYNDFKREITRIYTNQLINNKIDKTRFRNHVLNDYEYVPKPFCPKSKFHTPKVRVRLKPKYRCSDCKYEFEEASFISASELISIFFKDEEAYELRDKCFISKDEWRNKHNLSNIKYWFQREIAKNKDAESIEKQTLILTLDDNIKYLSFEDTITACKKCASSDDLHGMELCPKCNENYKGIEYPSCIECLPEEQRKKANEQIEFGKKMRDMHKKLGID